jgi:hypothetical protein
VKDVSSGDTLVIDASIATNGWSRRTVRLRVLWRNVAVARRSPTSGQ